MSMEELQEEKENRRETKRRRRRRLGENDTVANTEGKMDGHQGNEEAQHKKKQRRAKDKTKITKWNNNRQRSIREQEEKNTKGSATEIQL
jgi:hypothetical protein